MNFRFLSKHWSALNHEKLDMWNQYKRFILNNFNSITTLLFLLNVKLKYSAFQFWQSLTNIAIIANIGANLDWIIIKSNQWIWETRGSCLYRWSNTPSLTQCPHYTCSGERVLYSLSQLRGKTVPCLVARVRITIPRSQCHEHRLLSQTHIHVSATFCIHTPLIKSQEQQFTISISKCTSRWCKIWENNNFDLWHFSRQDKW